MCYGLSPAQLQGVPFPNDRSSFAETAAAYSVAWNFNNVDSGNAGARAPPWLLRAVASSVCHTS